MFESSLARYMEANIELQEAIKRKDALLREAIPVVEKQGPGWYKWLERAKAEVGE